MSSLALLVLVLLGLALAEQASRELCSKTCTSPNSFCNFGMKGKCGHADLPGVCTKKPEACTANFDPVCGCDGNTYGNECAANAAGVSAQHPGKCKQQTCGGLAGFVCSDATTYCEYSAAAMCGYADATGVCTKKPEACPANIDPVCGCDGNTYSNKCTANAVGVSVLRHGNCTDAPAKVCGGLAGFVCSDATTYCDFSPAAMCGAADATGVCRKKPEVCTDDYTPVCGCDGNTHSNECYAHLAGTSVLHSGQC